MVNFNSSFNSSKVTLFIKLGFNEYKTSYIESQIEKYLFDLISFNRTFVS